MAHFRKWNSIKFLYYFKIIIIWEGENKHEQGEGKKERKSQADSMLRLSRESDMVLYLTILYYDLSQNQESDGNRTEPPRHSEILLLFFVQ